MSGPPEAIVLKDMASKPPTKIRHRRQYPCECGPICGGLMERFTVRDLPPTETINKEEK